MSSTPPTSSGPADAVGPDSSEVTPAAVEAAGPTSEAEPEIEPPDAGHAAPETETERLLDDIKQVRE